MLNFFAKLCFTLTAVAPALGAAAIVAYAAHGSVAWAAAFGTVAVLCLLLLWLFLCIVKRQIPEASLQATSIEFADQRVLEFLLAYMLPVFSATSLDSMYGSLLLTVYSLVIVGIAIMKGNVFQFNPIMAMLGYHFYCVTSASNIQYLVVSRKTYHRAARTIRYKALSDYMFLEV